MNHMSMKSNDKNNTLLKFGNNSEVLIDSGTSFIVMPPHEITKIGEHFQNVIGLNNCSVDDILMCHCSKKQYDNIPDMVFNIDDKDYMIPRESYIYHSNDQCAF